VRRLASCHERPTRGSSRREDPSFLSPRALLYSLELLHVNDQAKGRGKEGEREVSDLSIYEIKRSRRENGKTGLIFQAEGKGTGGMRDSLPPPSSPHPKLLAVLYLAYGFYDDNETFFFFLSLSLSFFRDCHSLSAR